MNDDNFLGFKELTSTDEKIVAMLTIKGKVYVATEHHIYQLPKPKKPKKTKG